MRLRRKIIAFFSFSRHLERVRIDKFLPSPKTPIEAELGWLINSYRGMSSLRA